MGFLDSLLRPDVAALSKRGDVGGLVKALHYKKDPTVRSAAAEALGKRFDSGNEYDRVKCLLTEPESLRYTEGECRVVGEQDRDFLLESVQSSFGPEVVRGLQELLFQAQAALPNPSRVRLKDVAVWFTLRVTEVEGRKKCLAALAAAVNDDDAGVRSSAVRAIGRTWLSGGSAAARLQGWGLPDSSLRLGGVIAKFAALGVGPEEVKLSFDALRRAVQDGDESVRKIAVEALRSSADAEVIPLLSLAAENDQSPQVRKAAQEAREEIQRANR